MNIRNIKKISEEEYTCEYDHPQYGWIPYTALKEGDTDVMVEIFNICANTKNVEYDVESIKSGAEWELISSCNEKVTVLETKYDNREISLWNTKRTEAEKILNGGESTLIETEAKIKSISPLEIARKIISKNDSYNIKTVEMESIKYNIKKEFANASTLDQVSELKSKYRKILEGF